MMSDNDKIERIPTSRKKVAIAEKVKFSENLNKLFSKADEIFNKNDKQKPMFDDEGSLSKPDKMTIPHAQVIYKKLNEGKLPKQLRFFSSGNSGINELRIHATNKLNNELNKSNKAFLDYLTSHYAREILAKNKMEIHLDTGNIYHSNTNLEESIYDFLLAQQKETKKLLDYETNFTGGFDFYMNEIINPITDDRDDLHTHSASKFLFYHFNNLMHYLNEDTYKIRYTLISDNKYVLEVLQSKNWFYFTKKMLGVSQSHISLFNISRVEEDIKVINGTFDNLTVFKDMFLFKHWLCIPKVSASNARKTY